MNSTSGFLLLVIAVALLRPAMICAQTPAAEEEPEARVQYQFVRPEEKTPENVKPEEHNPFESESEAKNRLAPGDTEENRVRDKLLKLPVVGTKRMADGKMRVLLGDLILETGGVVPKVLAEQLVELHVKNITEEYIELAWQEKRATGLPPKLMIIPINIAPKVRYQLLGQGGKNDADPRATNATMDLTLHTPEHSTPPLGKELDATTDTPPRALFVQEDGPMSLTTPTPPPSATRPPATAQIVPPAKAVDKPSTPAPPPSSPVIDSVERMLFGTPAPVPK